MSLERNTWFHVEDDTLLPPAKVAENFGSMVCYTLSMLRELRPQYMDMAEGGDGGNMGAPKSVRETYYPHHTDAFFLEVCRLMGWANKWHPKGDVWARGL